MGESRHTQNTQINEVIGENEKNASFILWKKLNALFGQPHNSGFLILSPTRFCSLRLGYSVWLGLSRSL